MILALVLLSLLGCSEKALEVCAPAEIADFAKLLAEAEGCPPKPEPLRVPPEWEVGRRQQTTIARVAPADEQPEAWLSLPDNETDLPVDREKFD